MQASFDAAPVRRDSRRRPFMNVFSDPSADRDSCVALLHDLTAPEPGVTAAALDVAQRELRLSYDGARLSEPEATRLAEAIARPMQSRLAGCARGRSASACPACVRALEGPFGGARAAHASFAEGAFQVAYEGGAPERPRTHAHSLGGAPEPPPAPRSVRRWAAEHAEMLAAATTLLAMLGGLALEWRAGAVGAPAAALYALAYVAGGYFSVREGFEALREGRLDIDLLMVLAALGAAFIGQPFEGAMLLFLFSVSNVLEESAMSRTRSAIRALMQLRPSQALILRDGRAVAAPAEEVAVGEVMLLRPGDRAALDGTVRAGESELDQSSVTGESIPAPKAPGDPIFAGTINGAGALEVVVTRLAADSTIARLIKMVEEAQSGKARTQRFIDRAEQYYVVGVLAFTAAAIALPLLFLGEAFQTAFYRAMTLMVAASPCALVISTPATILSAIGNGARRGILFKGGAHVEQAATIRVFAFDKTGTLTQGKPRLRALQRLAAAEAVGPADDDALLCLAASVQARSEHALARATVQAAEARGLAPAEAAGFQAATGKGVSAHVGGLEAHIGNLRYFEAEPEAAFAEARRLVAAGEAEGYTTVIVALAHAGALAPVGVLSFADVLRPEAPEAVAALKRLGMARVVMLTGDNEEVARQIAGQAGVDAYYAGLLPEDKQRILRELHAAHGPVAMVGDGVNDAPALAAASLGIAMGAAGTDVALETADVVLMSDELRRLPYLVALSHATRRTLLVNLGFAFGMIVLMISVILAAHLALPLAVIGHEGSTVLVSLNGLRLLGFRWREA